MNQYVSQFPDVERPALIIHIGRCSVVMHQLLSQETLDK